MGVWRTNLADAELGLGHFDAAIDQIRQAIDAGYRTSYPYMELAAAYALEGKMDDAKPLWRRPFVKVPNSPSNRSHAQTLIRSSRRPAQGGAARRSEWARSVACPLPGAPEAYAIIVSHAYFLKCRFSNRSQPRRTSAKKLQLLAPNVLISCAR